MDERLTPDELRGLLGAFALGAVDANEREQVDEFVLDDRDARAELHQLEHAVAWLGHASPRPSEPSWDSLQLGMDRDLAGPGTVTSMVTFESRRNRRGWRQLVAVAAAAVILVGTAIGVARVIEKDSERPTIRTIALHAPSGRTAVEASIAGNGLGSIRTLKLPTAPAGHVYQLWTQPTTTAPMHSAGILGRSPAGQQIHIPPGSARIAISVEPDGGSPGTHHRPRRRQ